MFILVTPMSLSGAERPRPGVTGHSHSRSASSSRSSRPKVASLSILLWRWHVCSIFSLLMSFRSRMSCLARCWSCRRISVCKKREGNKCGNWNIVLTFKIIMFFCAFFPKDVWMEMSQTKVTILFLVRGLCVKCLQPHSVWAWVDLYHCLFVSSVRAYVHCGWMCRVIQQSTNPWVTVNHALLTWMNLDK